MVVMVLVIVALIIVAIGAIAYIMRNKEGTRERFVGNTGIPKHIWTYWDNEDTIPRTVKLCMESWRKHNPDYEITLLTKKNYAEYTRIPADVANHPNMNDMPQRFADLVRCYVIAEKGGIWVDSSTLMAQPLDEWLYAKPGGEFYGFSIIYGGITDRLPIIENWFFAAPPNSRFMTAWRDEFTRLTEFPTNKAYVDSRLAMGADVKGWWNPGYLTMHLAAQKLLQIDRYPLDGLVLLPAEKGPFRYVVDNGWDPHKALAAACANPALRKPFMKMRQNERGVLEAGFDGEFSNAKCGWV